jgi:hypothetical protein
MAAQSITTDQTTMTTFEAGATSTDFGGGQGSAGETDFYIQGSQCFSRKVSGTTAVVGFGVTGTGPTVAGQHVYVWVINQTPGLVNATTAGGVRVAIGSSGNAYDMFYVNGSEDLIGGWKCYPVNWQATPDASAGNPNNTNVVGALLSTTGTVNRNNLGVDAIRYGTGIDATGGGSPDPDLTFADIADEDSLVGNQWGILQPTPSGVALQGELRIGADDASTATTFNDTDAVLTKPNNNPSGVNVNTTATFSGITLQGSLTDATFTGCLFLSLDTHDTGYIDASSATNAATASFDLCTFLDWGTFDGRSTVTLDGCAFKNSGVVTTNGSTIANSSFINCSPVDVGTALGDISNSDFTSGGTGHAITTSVNSGTVSFIGNSFTGYSGTGANAAINFTATTGSVTVNVSGGAIPSFQTAGVSVTFALSNSLTLTGLKTNTEVRVYQAGTTTELAGEENNTTGTFNASISVSAVDIVIFNLEYIAIRLTNVDTTSNRTIPIQQQEDRQYENP